MIWGPADRNPALLESALPGRLTPIANHLGLQSTAEVKLAGLGATQFGLVSMFTTPDSRFGKRWHQQNNQ